MKFFEAKYELKFATINPFILNNKFLYYSQQEYFKVDPNIAINDRG